MTLPCPYGSSPKHSGQYVLYVSRHGDDGTQVMVQIFAQPYSARKFLDVLLADDGYIWEDDCTIRSETGIVVSTRWWPGRLRKCIEHEYSLAEMAWELDPMHLKTARAFRHGPEMPRTLEEATGGDAQPRTRRAPSGPRASRDGLVPVADVALALGVEPRDCRAALRRAKIPKPAAGWAWTASEVEAIKTQIKGLLK